MKINLSSVNVKPTISGPEETIDITKEVADAIYRQSHSVGETKFALKLFDADGEIEVTEQEAGYIRSSIGIFLYWVQQPVLEMLGE